MTNQSRKPINPTLITIASIPSFLLGGLLAAMNWNRLGYPHKARNTVKWCIIGTIAIAVIAYFIPVETLRKLWSVGLGINLGTGMALRTLQLPDYNRYLGKAEAR